MQAVIAIGFAAFIFNTSEFVPVGLLSLIAEDLGITEARVGLLMSVYACVVALSSLPLMLMCSRFDLRRLLLCVVALFIVSHVGSTLAVDYWTLMISRIGVACAHALFWSIATPMAVRAAPSGKESLAISFVIVGTSIALLAGLPIGRMIGLLFGWRMSFLVIGVIAFLVLLVLGKTLPKMPSGGAVSLRTLPTILKMPQLLGIYVITMCLVTAHFIAYSYIEPFLAQSAHLSQNTITITLVIFGAMGILGGFLFSKFHDGHENSFLNFALFGVCVSLLALRISSIFAWSVIAVCVLWGLCIIMFGLAFQARILKLVPVGTAIAMSIFSGIYNVGIGSGAALGGLITERIGVESVGYFGAVLSFAVWVYYRGWFVRDSTLAKNEESQLN